MRNAELEEAQSGIQIAKRNINNLRYADDIIVMAESERELKTLLTMYLTIYFALLDSLLYHKQLKVFNAVSITVFYWL